MLRVWDSQRSPSARSVAKALSVHRTLLGLWDRHRRVATGLASGGRPAALRVTDDTARHLRYTSRAKREADVSLSHRCTMEHPVAPWSTTMRRVFHPETNGVKASPHRLKWMLSHGAPADPSDPWNSHAAPVSPRQNGQVAVRSLSAVAAHLAAWARRYRRPSYLRFSHAFCNAAVSANALKNAKMDANIVWPRRTAAIAINRLPTPVRISASSLLSVGRITGPGFDCGTRAF